MIKFDSFDEQDTRRSPSPVKKSNFISEVQQKLLEQEAADNRQGVHVPTVGALALKKTYEKLNAKQEPNLLGPRTLKLQAALDDMTANSGIKSLEQIKAEKENVQWKWKNKNHEELYEEMRTLRNKIASDQ